MDREPHTAGKRLRYKKPVLLIFGDVEEFTQMSTSTTAMRKNDGGAAINKTGL